MTTELLLREFSRISEAPNAITRLRRYVLELAVRGKLVPRNPSEGDAFELVTRMEADRARRSRTHLAAKSTPDTRSAVEPPFRIPSSWLWVRFRETLVGHVGGGTPSKNNAAYWGGNISWASVKDVGRSKELTTTIDFITNEGLTNSSSNLVPPGRLIVVTRMGLGKVSINRVPIAINQDLRALEPSPLMDINYQYIFLKTHDFKGTGLTVKGIRVDELLSVPFPLPPMAEQRRIVAKVDELMALCDQLEVAQLEREIRRDAFRAATIRRLMALDRDAMPSTADVRFFIDRFPQLITKPEHVDAVRDTILNLAVSGQLGTSDGMAGPRTGWTTRTLREVLTHLQTGPFGSSLHKSDYVLGGTPVVNPASLVEGRIVPSPMMAVGPDTVARLASFKLRENDVVLARRGEMGRCAMVTSDEVGWLCGTGSLILRFPDSILASFMALLIGSPGVRKYLGGTAVGSTMQNLNQSILLNLPVGLPPLDEQHRIVAEVRDLMAVCDQLEVGLAAARDRKGRLMETLLHDALNAIAVPGFAGIGAG